MSYNECWSYRASCNRGRKNLRFSTQLFISKNIIPLFPHFVLANTFVLYKIILYCTPVCDLKIYIGGERLKTKTGNKRIPDGGRSFCTPPRAVASREARRLRSTAHTTERRKRAHRKNTVASVRRKLESSKDEKKFRRSRAYFFF